MPDDSLTRKKQEKIVNEHGRCLLVCCKATGLKILNGRTGLDKDIGKLTCVNSQDSNSIDYVMCRSDCFNFVKRFCVNEPNILSD